MDGRPNRRDKAAFQIFQGQCGLGLILSLSPLDVKCGTFATHFWVSANFVGDKGID